MANYVETFVNTAMILRSDLEGQVYGDKLDGNIHLIIKAIFPLHRGDMKVECTVHLDGGSKLGYKDYIVTGPNLEVIMDEALRRVMADKRLAPLCLPRVQYALKDDEVAF